MKGNEGNEGNNGNNGNNDVVCHAFVVMAVTRLQITAHNLIPVSIHNYSVEKSVLVV
jgi:hypothetical protein